MLYNAFSLDGDYVMDYTEEDYTSDAVPAFPKSRSVVRGAIPGYFEDMTEKFQKTHFYGKLRVNPEYGAQHYPIAGVAPDMALPNVFGTFFYFRNFDLETTSDGVTIAFPQVHIATAVWLNGRFLGRHIGYSTHFEIDLPEDALRLGVNELVIAVSNHRQGGFDGQPVTGITSRAASEYSGGISDHVELRVYRSPLRDAAVLISPDLATADVRVESVAPVHFAWEVKDGSRVLLSGEADGDFTFPTEGLAHWSPDSPKRYTLRLTAGDATLDVPFGVRRLTTRGLSFLMNGEPVYLAGVTEHCYYPMTVWPSRDVAYYRNVIKKFKELGFNYIRFHTVVPTEQYMQAADELGILLEVESPNYTSYTEWCEILRFCRRHPSVVMYCCGNELQMQDDFIAHIEKCADRTHAETDALFSPMNAMRGLEYCCGLEPELLHECVDKPFQHNPRRFRWVSKFSDCYNAVLQSMCSHRVLEFNRDFLDSTVCIEGFDKPRIGHEISIDGTYTDLSLIPRYRGTRIGSIDMFASIERHLTEKGVIDKAPIYFRNSCEWQRRMRKFTFEQCRRLRTFMGYDYLGPIDTHWHTFGYDVGMMNEFYELKPGETVRNVRMYNNQTVLLNDLHTRTNFAEGEQMRVGIELSLFGVPALSNATLDLTLETNGRVLDFVRVPIAPVPVGDVSPIYTYTHTLAKEGKPKKMLLHAALHADGLFVENEWELYAFPDLGEPSDAGITVMKNASLDDVIAALDRGEDVFLFGKLPFVTASLSFQMAKAGRTAFHTGTVIYDHPVMNRFPHEGFAGWQFRPLMNGTVQWTNLNGDSAAVCFATDKVPFDPIFEVVSSHKNVIKRAALFEYRVGRGRLMVSGLTFDGDVASTYMKNLIFDYMRSEEFMPRHTISTAQLRALAGADVEQGIGNTNLSLNPNDKTAFRKKTN